MASKKLRRNF